MPNCDTCRFAIWKRTKTGKIRRSQSESTGKCGYKIVWPKMPQSILGGWRPFTPPDPAERGLWFGDEEDCDVHETQAGHDLKTMDGMEWWAKYDPKRKDPNWGRTCICGGAIPAGYRYAHSCPETKDRSAHECM